MSDILDYDYDELETKTSDIVDNIGAIEIDEIVSWIEAGSIAIEKVLNTYDELLATTNEYIALLESDMGLITKSITEMKNSDNTISGN